MTEKTKYPKVTYNHGEEERKFFSELQAMLVSVAGQAHSDENRPAGFKERWKPYFLNLFLVACLMRVESVMGRKSPWQDPSHRPYPSTNMSSYPDLYRCLEAMRCVRNCIVHNNSKIKRDDSFCEKAIEEFDEDVNAGNIKYELAETKIKPFYELEEDGSLQVTSAHRISRIVIAYLRVEGVIDLDVQ